MEFRLVYKGALPAEGAGGSRTKEKHAIRKALHSQLRDLWNQHGFLRSNIEYWADNYQRCGFRFVPLVRSRYPGATCNLDILFLRRDNPGNLVRSGGDIDNRIKVLFNGLKMPGDCGQLGGATPDPDEDPFFCLLEDDSLITEVRVTTDRLLIPLEDQEHIHDVMLVIHVVVKSALADEMV